MNNSEQLLSKPLTKANKWIVIAILVFSIIGFVDATYLTAEHYLGVPINCSIFDGCEEVLNSEYSVMFGLPMALYGSVYYLIVLVLTIIYLDTKKENIINFVSKFTVVGFIASLYFVCLQFFVLNALCLYCMISAASSTILFALGLSILLVKKRT